MERVRGRPKGSRNKASDIDFQRRLAKATEKGRLQAQKEASRDHAKFNLEHLWTSLSEHVGKAFDRIDPIETAAVLGATYIIKGGIDWTQGAFKNLTDNLKKHPIPGVVIPGFYKFVGAGAGFIDTGEIEEWIISFVLAFIIVHNFGLIMQTLGSGVQGLLKMAGLLVAV